MSSIGQPERATQRRIITLFQEELGYRFLGDWSDRAGNSNIEDKLLSTHLSGRGYSLAQIARALEALHRGADHHGRNLYGNNQAVYTLLRYGVPVTTEAGTVTETVHLIDWHHPDLVLYVNGIAIGVLELKNSRVSISDGIRQSLSNQQPEFNAWFFSTAASERRTSSS